jgi:hypothetical protein
MKEIRFAVAGAGKIIIGARGRYGKNNDKHQ